MAKINGTDYPALGPHFLHDLKVELGATLEAIAAGPLPVAADRDYPQTIELEVPLKGVNFHTEPGSPPKVIATWAFRKPDGSTHRMDCAVPENVRQAMAASPAPNGDAMVTAVYDATLPQALAVLRLAWGVAP